MFVNALTWHSNQSKLSQLFNITIILPVSFYHDTVMIPLSDDT